MKISFGVLRVMSLFFQNVSNVGDDTIGAFYQNKIDFDQLDESEIVLERSITVSAFHVTHFLQKKNFLNSKPLNFTADSIPRVSWGVPEKTEVLSTKVIVSASWTGSLTFWN